MEGGIHIEAKGLGVLIRKPLLATESPFITADNLVHSEDKKRKFLFRRFLFVFFISRKIWNFVTWTKC